MYEHNDTGRDGALSGIKNYAMGRRGELMFASAVTGENDKYFHLRITACLQIPLPNSIVWCVFPSFLFVFSLVSRRSIRGYVFLSSSLVKASISSSLMTTPGF
jgi:hypothetical protein